MAKPVLGEVLAHKVSAGIIDVKPRVSIVRHTTGYKSSGTHPDGCVPLSMLCSP